MSGLFTPRPAGLEPEYTKMLVHLLVEKLGGHVTLTEQEIDRAYGLTGTKLFVERRVGVGLILEVVPNAGPRKT